MVPASLQKPRSGERLQPTARAVGAAGKTRQAPAGRKKMSHTFGNILLHMIFSTQGRRPLIKPDFRADLFAYLGGIIREMNATALIINGVSDHVHLLVRIRPAHSPAEIARVVKANSSRWVHEKWDEGFAWQTGYGVFSVSESSVPAVTKYIAELEEHHRKHSFQEEYIAFLKKNKVAHDERYIWD
jgi:putative transposase